MALKTLGIHIAEDADWHTLLCFINKTKDPISFTFFVEGKSIGLTASPETETVFQADKLLQSMGLLNPKKGNYGAWFDTDGSLTVVTAIQRVKNDTWTYTPY